MSSRSNTRAFPEALAPLAAPGVHRSTRAAVSAVRDRGARGDAASLASPPDPPSVEDHLLLDSGMTPEPIKVRFGQGLFDSWQSFPEELLPSGSSSVRMPSSLEEAAMFRRSQPHGSAGWNIPPGVENAPTAARAARLCELAKAPLLNPVDSPGATDLPPTADAPAWAKDHRRFASAQDVYAHLGEIDLGGALVIVRFCLGGPESPPAHGHDSDAASEDMLRFSPPVLLVVGSLGTPFLSDPGYNFADHFTAQGIEVFLPSMIPVATDMSPMIASLDATLQDVTPSRLSDVLLSERAAATLFWQKGIKLCAPFQSPVTLDDNVPQDSAWFPLMASLQESRELLTSHEVPLVLSARPLSEANRTPGAWQFCRAFPLPRDHGLPTGLAVELSADLSLAQFRSVVAAHQHQSTLEETAWLDSPWAEAWFASVANQPDFFITDVCQFPLVQDTLKPLLSGPYDSPALARAWPAMFLQLKADISFCRVIKNGFSFRPGTQNDQAVQNWITRYTRFLENCDTVMTANARCFSELRPMPPYARNPFAQMLLRPETRAWLERFDVRSVVAHLDSDSWALRSYEPIIVPVDSTYAPDSIPTFHLAPNAVIDNDTALTAMRRVSSAHLDLFRSQGSVTLRQVGPDTISAAAGIACRLLEAPACRMLKKPTDTGIAIVVGDNEGSHPDLSDGDLLVLQSLQDDNSPPFRIFFEAVRADDTSRPVTFRDPLFGTRGDTPTSVLQWSAKEQSFKKSIY